MKHAVLVAALVLGACSRGSVAPSAPPQQPASADLKLLDPRLDLGRTVAGGYVDGVVRLQAGPAGAVLTQFSPSCGCTLTRTLPPVTLKPNEILEAPVALDLSRLSDLGAPQDGKPHLVERTIHGSSHGGSNFDVTLAVIVSERVKLEPPQARLGTVPVGRAARAEVTVSSYEGVPPPHVVSVDSGRADLAWTSDASDASGARGLLVWTPAKPEALDSFVTLRLDDAREPAIRLRVQGQAERPVVVDPEEIVDLSAPISQPKVVRIALHRVDEQPLQLLAAGCTAHRVELEIEGGEGPARTVLAVIPVLPLPGEILGTIQVRTDCPGAEVIEVPVHVRAQR